MEQVHAGRSLVDLLAPRRFTGVHLWTIVIIAGLWLLDWIWPGLAGFPAMMLLLLGPILLVAGPFMAGWQAQLTAAKNYVSPLDSPQALELLLTTPLTGKEIVSATLMAHSRYPLMGLTFRRIVPLVINIFIWLNAVDWAINTRGSIHDEYAITVASYYLPAVCVLIYSPLLSGLELLMIPSAWLHRRHETGVQTAYGRGWTGWLMPCAVALAIGVVILIQYLFPSMAVGYLWIIKVCPVIIIATALLILIIAKLLPGHLERLRRG